MSDATSAADLASRLGLDPAHVEQVFDRATEIEVVALRRAVALVRTRRDARTDLVKARAASFVLVEILAEITGLDDPLAQAAEMNALVEQLICLGLYLEHGASLYLGTDSLDFAEKELAIAAIEAEPDEPEAAS